jgi:hypothetical protein
MVSGGKQSSASTFVNLLLAVGSFSDRDLKLADRGAGGIVPANLKPGSTGE